MLEALEKDQLNIQALAVSETAEFGIVHMILSDPDVGASVLKKAGFTTRQDWIISAEIPDLPGGLLRNITESLAGAGINISYFYAFIEPVPGKTRIVLKVNNPEKAEQIIGQNR